MGFHGFLCFLFVSKSRSSPLTYPHWPIFLISTTRSIANIHRHKSTRDLRKTGHPNSISNLLLQGRPFNPPISMSLHNIHSPMLHSHFSRLQYFDHKFNRRRQLPCDLWVWLIFGRLSHHSIGHQFKMPHPLDATKTTMTLSLVECSKLDRHLLRRCWSAPTVVDQFILQSQL